MAATRKTTRGLIVIICNCNRYQSPKTYKRTTNATADTARMPQCAATINKHYKHLSIETKRKRAIPKLEKSLKSTKLFLDFTRHFNYNAVWYGGQRTVHCLRCCFVRTDMAALHRSIASLQCGIINWQSLEHKRTHKCRCSLACR